MVESQAPTKEIIGWVGGPLSHCHCWVSSKGLGMQKAAGFACAKSSAWNCESQADRRGAYAMKPGLESTLRQISLWGLCRACESQVQALCAIGGGASRALLLSLGWDGDVS